MERLMPGWFTCDALRGGCGKQDQTLLLATPWCTIFLGLFGSYRRAACVLGRAEGFHWRERAVHRGGGIGLGRF